MLHSILRILCSYCTHKAQPPLWYCEGLITYPYPVPFLPGFVVKFLPDDLYGLLAFFTGLNAPTGPDNVP